MTTRNLRYETFQDMLGFLIVCRHALFCQFCHFNVSHTRHINKFKSSDFIFSTMRKRIRSCPKNIGNSSSDDGSKDIIDPYESKRTTRHHWSSRDISTTDEYDESDLERQVCICIRILLTFFFLFRVIATCLIGSKMHFLTSFCKPVASESFCRKAIIKVKLVKLTNVCTISIF